MRWNTSWPSQGLVWIRIKSTMLESIVRGFSMLQTWFMSSNRNFWEGGCQETVPLNMVTGLCKGRDQATHFFRSPFVSCPKLMEDRGKSWVKAQTPKARWKLTVVNQACCLQVPQHTTKPGPGDPRNDGCNSKMTVRYHSLVLMVSFCLFALFCFVSLTEDRLIWEEKISSGKMPPSDWCVGKSTGHFLDWWEGAAHCKWCPPLVKWS